jgi:hypothetical protein
MTVPSCTPRTAKAGSLPVVPVWAANVAKIQASGPREQDAGSRRGRFVTEADAT